ncbi:MAG TPA: hypothetical protein VGO47_09095 [Chlamydiales bacterium]|nr:hypothetical protein [Chlamydiales bacterium]
MLPRQGQDAPFSVCYATPARSRSVSVSTHLPKVVRTAAPHLSAAPNQEGVRPSTSTIDELGPFCGLEHLRGDMPGRVLGNFVDAGDA